MSKLDDLANTAPVQPIIPRGAVPLPGPPASNQNAFTEVTIKQLYFFMWKWFAAAILFALPFLILRILILMFEH
jgi:hypothetical protein